MRRDGFEHRRNLPLGFGRCLDEQLPGRQKSRAALLAGQPGALFLQRVVQSADDLRGDLRVDFVDLEFGPSRGRREQDAYQCECS